MYSNKSESIKKNNKAVFKKKKNEKSAVEARRGRN